MGDSRKKKYEDTTNSDDDIKKIKKDHVAMKKIDTAHEIISQLGAVKKTTALRRKSIFSSKKYSDDELYVKEKIKMINRAVMRHPNSKVMHALIVLHSKIKMLLTDMEDGALDWLLEGNASESRGGFSNEKKNGVLVKTRVQKLKEFLDENPAHIRPQALLTKLETILTSMLYQKINGQPETLDEKLMKALLEYVIGNLPPHIGRLYTERNDDNLSQSDIYNKNIQPDSILEAEAEDLSSSSETDENEKMPKESQKKKFRKFVDSKGMLFSWIGASSEGKIPFKGHVSGTVASNMYIIDKLFKSNDTPTDWFDNDENAKMLTGALFLATFERGGYHTIAETSAGIEYYLNFRKSLTHSKFKYGTVEPYVALDEALRMLESVADDTKGVDERMSLKEAIHLIIPSIMEKVKYVESRSVKIENKI